MTCIGPYLQLQLTLEQGQGGVRGMDSHPLLPVKYSHTNLDSPKTLPPIPWMTHQSRKQPMNNIVYVMCII